MANTGQRTASLWPVQATKKWARPNPIVVWLFQYWCAIFVQSGILLREGNFARMNKTEWGGGAARNREGGHLSANFAKIPSGLFLCVCVWSWSCASILLPFGWKNGCRLHFQQQWGDGKRPDADNGHRSARSDVDLMFWCLHVLDFSKIDDQSTHCGRTER